MKTTTKKVGIGDLLKDAKKKGKAFHAKCVKERSWILYPSFVLYGITLILMAWFAKALLA